MRTLSGLFRFGLLALAALVSAAGAQTFTPREETPEQFPAGAGREEAFYACTACHNFKLVAAQGMTRRQCASRDRDDTQGWHRPGCICPILHSRAE